MGKIEPSLAKVKRHTLNGNTLTLLDENARAIMALSRITATGLENRELAIAEYWDGNALVPVEGTAYIVFMHGRIRGTPGCGGLWGAYSLFEQRVRLNGTAILAGWCPQPAMVQMKRVTAALGGDRLVEHEPHRTVLRDLQGAVRIVLRPY
ncbi:MAG TPA: hypothetical protein VFZ16_16220 [Hyphomicrobiaceae bacterium]|nr:hypothetical protein [Hyphomicrobiaceae bacterium]